MKQSKTQEERFFDLVARVQACRKCPRMTNSARVLGPGCGSLNAKTVFIGEAPGRLGADDSQLPFHGDKAGDNFERLIAQVGISRYDIFVTNAVLCNPKDSQGNNATPTTTEIANCASFLKEQIEIIDPEEVVPLGAVALKACSLIERHSLTLKNSVRKAYKWFGRYIIPLYHPGQRAMVHRSFSNQLADYQFVAERLRRRGNGRPKAEGRRSKGGARDEKIIELAKRIIEHQADGVGYFALHKMFFLAEVVHMEAVGERLTSAYIVRQKDGPYCVDLHIGKLQGAIPELIVERKAAKIRLRMPPQWQFGERKTTSPLSIYEARIVDQVVAKYGNYTDAKLKTASYMARPMRALLRKEKKLGLNLFNAPILLHSGGGRKQSAGLP